MIVPGIERVYLSVFTICIYFKGLLARTALRALAALLTALRLLATFLLVHVAVLTAGFFILVRALFILVRALMRAALRLLTALLPLLTCTLATLVTALILIGHFITPEAAECRGESLSKPQLLAVPGIDGLCRRS
jgi:hypothetical protein